MDTRKQTSADQDKRNSERDRRAADERRRSARGLFELRARRDRIVEDRRQRERRADHKWFVFWRGTGS